MKIMGKIPEGWMPYSPIGNQVPGTRFIAFKVPLRESFVDKLKPEDRFTVPILLERVPELGLIIDLTQTLKYYNKNEVLDRGVDYVKIPTPGQVVPTQQYVDRFFEVVDYYLDTHKNDGSLIGVHCTHGVNRTGYMLCRYLIQRLGYSFEDAVDAVGTARGHMIERSPYLTSLRDHRDIVQKKTTRADIEEGKSKMSKKASSVKPQKKLSEQRPAVTGKERFSRRDDSYPPPGREVHRSRSPVRERPLGSQFAARDFGPGMGRERISSHNVRDRLEPPVAHRGRTPPPPHHMRGHTPPPPHHMRGHTPPHHMRGRTPPPPHHMRGRTPPPPHHMKGHGQQHMRGRTPPYQEHMRRGTPPPHHPRGRSPPPPQQIRGRGSPPPHHARGRISPPPQPYAQERVNPPPIRRTSPPPQMRGRSPPGPPMRGRTPPPQMRSRTPPLHHLRGRSPTRSHMRGRSPAPMRGRTPPHVRGRSPPHHVPPEVGLGRASTRGRSPPPVRIRERTPPYQSRVRTPTVGGHSPPLLSLDSVSRSPGNFPRREAPVGRARSPPRGREAPSSSAPIVSSPPTRREPFPPGRRTPPLVRHEPSHGRSSPPSSRREPIYEGRPPPNDYYRGEYERRMDPYNEGSRDYSHSANFESRQPYQEEASGYTGDSYDQKRRERSRSPHRREDSYYPERRREASPSKEMKRRRRSPPSSREKPFRSPSRYLNGRDVGFGEQRGVYPEDNWERNPTDDGPDCRQILNERRSLREPYPPESAYDERKRSLVERLPPKNVDLRESLEEEKRRKQAYVEPGYSGEAYGSTDRKKQRREYPDDTYVDRPRYEEQHYASSTGYSGQFNQEPRVEGGEHRERFGEEFRGRRGQSRGGKKVFDRLARGRRGARS